MTLDTALNAQAAPYNARMRAFRERTIEEAAKVPKTIPYPTKDGALVNPLPSRVVSQVKLFATKKAAQADATKIGWPKNTATQVETRFAIQWVLVDSNKQILTQDGWIHYMNETGNLPPV